VGVAGFLVCFAAASALIALWLDHRAPRLAPSSLRAIFVHVAGAFVVAQFVAPLLMDAMIDGSSSSVLVAIFVVGLPAVTYSFLAALWLIKLLAGMARGLPH
jgi:hypothetical protein